MIKIKYLKFNYIVLSLLIFVLLAINIPNKDELIINEIKISYEDKVDLTNNQIEKINNKNKHILSSDEMFMIGYINLFVYNNKSLAYEYFEQVIENKNKAKSDFARAYSYKFLAEKYIEDGNEAKAIEYTKNALYSINPKNHGEYRNLINDIIRPIMEFKESRSMIIDFLEYILLENYNHPDIQAEFYAHRTLSEFYLLTGSYYQSAENNIKTIEIGSELGKEYFIGKSLVNLAKINYIQGDSNKALKLIEEVNSIKAEDLEWNDKLNTYKLLIVSEIEKSLGNIDKALEYVNEMNNYKDNLTYEDRLDINIVQNIMLSNIYIEKNELELAKEYLDESYYMLDIDKVAYWQDKDIYYYTTYGRLSEKMGDYSDAKQHYEKAKNLSIERKNLEG
ncbi:MAG: tetratricopeptide repeat protein, partial [Peptostreptococcaceae bacterium]